LYGWFNKYIEIDLGSNNVKTGIVPEEILRSYLGGRGLGVKLFIDKTKSAIDPLSPDNILVFAVGPLTATTVPTSGRSHVVSKSPLTDTIFESNTGGFWGYKFKKCGLIALIIKSRAEKPVYIKIFNDEVSINSAESIWGLDVNKAHEKLIKLEGRNYSSLIIGPAGEKLVKYASIINDQRRAFGRGGIGAVMGSKLLKAIIVNGNQEIPIYDRESLDIYVKTARDKLLEAPITSQGLSEFGTAALVNIINLFGLFPINNFQKGCDERSKFVSGEAIKNEFFIKKEACYNCPIACGRIVQTSKIQGKGPEYETVWALGPQCGIFDLETIIDANYYCNNWGLDTISVGVTIACEMELNQRGKSNSGIEFGDKDKIIDLLKMITFREGIGNELAEGSFRLAQKKDGLKYAMQIKKLEMPAYDPRGAIGHALGYATSNRGACHLRGNMIGMEILGVPKLIDRFSLTGKPDLLKIIQDEAAVIDSLLTCKFMNFSVGMDHLSRMTTAVTGVSYTIESLREIGERIFNLERLYNIREGLTRNDDLLPERFLTEPLKEGPSSGIVVNLNFLLDHYYMTRGWDINGIPTKETLNRLGLMPLK